MRIAILGGTGSFGMALAARLVAAGDDVVVIGSRDEVRAKAAAPELAVKADAALETARSAAAALGRTPLLSVASDLRFSRDGVRPDPDARSLAERIQDVVAGPVVAGLHSIAAANLDAAASGEDALVCGDDPAAKELALALAAKLVSGRALDAGPLASARTLEGLTAVIVNLNRRYRAHAGITVTGISAT